MNAQEKSTARQCASNFDFFNDAPIGLVWLSANGTILRANAAQLALLGCRGDDYLGHSFSEFIVEPARGYALLKSLAARETVRDFSLPMRCLNGTIRHVLVDANAFWTDRQIHCSSIFVRDINDRVEMERGIVLASERERRRIAQDLHDGLGQLLVGAAYLTGIVKQDLAARDFPESRQLDRILEVLEEAKTQTRIMDREVRPVEPHADGLMLALERMGERTQNLFHIRCHFKCPRPVLIQDHMVATHLFRIAQEAVTNAIKHASPERIEISLTDAPGQIILAVNDDGLGMSARQRKPAGMGLDNMRRRAAMIVSSLAIQKEADGGTTVVCTVNLSGEHGFNHNSRTALEARLARD